MKANTSNDSGHEKQYCSSGTSSEEDTEQPNSKNRRKDRIKQYLEGRSRKAHTLFRKGPDIKKKD